MATTHELAADEAVATRLVAALVRQDWAAIEACFSPASIETARVEPGSDSVP